MKLAKGLLMAFLILSATATVTATALAGPYDYNHLSISCNEHTKKVFIKRVPHRSVKDFKMSVAGSWWNTYVFLHVSGEYKKHFMGNLKKTVRYNIYVYGKTIKPCKITRKYIICVAKATMKYKNDWKSVSKNVKVFIKTDRNTHRTNVTVATWRSSYVIASNLESQVTLN